MTMTYQVNNVIRICSYTLRGIRKIRKYLTPYVLKTLVVNLVISKIDFLNSLYTNLSKNDISRLNVLLNNCARLVTFSSLYVSITPVLFGLH